MKVINYLDTYEKLKIVQDTNMNNFTIDSILLADFVKLKKKDNLIVDLCSGNAPIAMFLTLKKEDIKIWCVEIQEENCNLAKESITLNNLEDKIEVINKNLINVSDIIGKNKIDVVVCNPPYFRVDNTSNLNDNKNYSLARHEIEVNLEQIICESRKLLDNKGSLYFVHRPERIDEIIILLDKHNFEIKTLRFVSSFLEKEANTVLIEARRGKSQNNKVRVLSPLIIYKSVGVYTDEMIQIMKMQRD